MKKALIMSKINKTSAFGILLQLLTVLFAATMSFAQADATKKETPMNQNMPSTDSTAIRPFHFKAAQADLDDLGKRIAATRWPEKETVADQTQGVQLATIQKLAHYWATQYDWRKCEARLDALPQFITEIDGLDIHFIHVRSKHKNALPVINKGGHFAAWEQPEFLVGDLRAAFKSLR